MANKRPQTDQPAAGPPGKRRKAATNDESDGFEDVDESGSEAGPETQVSQEPDDGEVACGLIKSVYAHQFMCHADMKVGACHLAFVVGETLGKRLEEAR